MTIDDLLVDPPYNKKGIDQFQRREAKEIWFINRNFLKCPICRKATPMRRVRCEMCGADMKISKWTFEKLLKIMMNTPWN